jgi:decaprenylphospho-beta-D-erythro-pentofuranosid-2-ulose 2-reductase
VKDALGSVQSVLLLGGTSDIGLAAVRALRPARTVLAARDTEGAARAIAGAEVVFFDAMDPGSRRSAIAQAFEGGDVDLVLVAFGALEGEPEHLHALNGTATVAAMTEATQHLRRQGHGTLILLSSVAADRPRPANYAYGSSKAAADAYARGLGFALRGSGVEVLIVRPGFVRTAMTAHLDSAPLAVGADEVASAIADAIRRRRAIAYVPAAMRWVSLVLQLLPPPVFRRLPF